MKTVLGLSMSSTGLGWVLLDESDTTGAVLDHDAFDFGADAVGDGDVSRHVAAVRGAQAIATSDGHRITSVGVTWTDDVDGQANLLLKSLPDLGFENVTVVRLPHAASQWARAFGPVLGFRKCAVCVIESAAVTVLAAGNGTVRTSVTHMRESADGLSRWLSSVFEKNGWEPDRVFLVGPRGDLELISSSLQQTLPMPVEASEDVQLALARGTAIAVAPDAKIIDLQVNSAEDDTRHKQPIWPRRKPRPRPAKKPARPDLPKADEIEAWTAALKPARPRPVAPVRAPADSVTTTMPAVPVAETVEPARVAAAAEPTVEAKAPEASPAENEVAEVKAEVVEVQAVQDEAVQTKVIELPVPAPIEPVVAEPKSSTASNEAAGDETTKIDTAGVDTADDKTAVIATVTAPRPDRKRRWPAWYGPHARAATVVLVGLVAFFSLGPLLGGQKDTKPAEQLPASGSATTSISVHAVPSPLPPPTVASIHQVAGEPLAPPLPEAMPPAVPAIEAAAPVDVVEPAPPAAAEPLPTAAEPVTAAPVAAPAAIAEPAPATLPPAPEAPAPAPEAPAADAPPPGEPVAPPPPDPIMVVLGPLFGALP